MRFANAVEEEEDGWDSEEVHFSSVQFSPSTDWVVGETRETIQQKRKETWGFTSTETIKAY